MSDIKILLSREDEERVSELAYDREAAHKAFDYAMTHAQNTFARIVERDKRMWEHLAQTHGLNLEHYEYKIAYDKDLGRMVIVKKRKLHDEE